MRFQEGMLATVWWFRGRIPARPARFGCGGFNWADWCEEVGRLLICPYISWQITSSGQTERAQMPLEGWIVSVLLSFLCFFWLPVCKQLLRTSAEGHFFPLDLEGKQGVTSDGKNCSLTSDLCVCGSLLLLSQDSHKSFLFSSEEMFGLALTQHSVLLGREGNLRKQLIFLSTSLSEKEPFNCFSAPTCSTSAKQNPARCLHCERLSF